MSTARELAATVRDALEHGSNTIVHGDALDALDALVAECERLEQAAGTGRAALAREVATQYDRAEAAERERDYWKAQAQGNDTDLPPPEESKAEARAEAAERERDEARASLEWRTSEFHSAVAHRRRVEARARRYEEALRQLERDLKAQQRETEGGNYVPVMLHVVRSALTEDSDA